MNRPGSIAARTLAVAALVLAPSLVEAREPLPYVEIVQPPKRVAKRVRLLDVRWSAQVGGGFSLGQRVPVLSLAHSGHISFVELSKTTHLHVALDTGGFVDVTRGWQRRRGVLGTDVGLGVSRHVPGGPAMVATVTAGPRWVSQHRGATDALLAPASRWRVDGWGMIGKIDAYPFYATIPELVKSEERWFRRYVLSGLHLWVAGRYDLLRDGTRTPTFTGGVGLDLGRTLLLPILVGTRRG